MVFSVGIVILGTASVLLVCRASRPLFAAFRQPPVVAELCVGIIVGILLTSVFHLDAHVLATLKSGLYWFSEPALLVYMYCLGYEVERRAFKSKFRDSVLIATCAFGVPFAITAWLLRLHWGPLIDPPSTLGSLAICGVVSATAFPVLARILRATGLMVTRVGTVALSAAAVNDLISWTLLAVLTVLVRPGSAKLEPSHLAGATICITAAYVGGHTLRRTSHPVVSSIGSFAIGIFAMFTAVLIGIDPTIGAFASGLCTPRSPIVSVIIAKSQSLATKALPLFFCYSGLGTELTASVDMLPAAVFWAALSTITKGGAAFLAAIGRMSRLEALAVGVLMNCRGLVGIIFLSLALRNGLIKPLPYSILILVSLITTLMCTPVVRWLDSSDRGGLRLIATRSGVTSNSSRV